MLIEITNHILNRLPKETKLTTEEIITIQSNKPFFIDIIDNNITDFFDILYTNVILKESEIAAKEESLKKWFKGTLEGNFDLGYWSWQSFVGLTHVKQKVKNNIMIVLMSRFSDIVLTEAILKMSKEDTIKLISAWLKLSNIVLALIIESYHIFYMKAVEEATGLTQNLIDNTVKVEIDNLIDLYSGFNKHV